MWLVLFVFPLLLPFWGSHSVFFCSSVDFLDLVRLVLPRAAICTNIPMRPAEVLSSNSLFAPNGTSSSEESRAWIALEACTRSLSLQVRMPNSEGRCVSSSSAGR